MSKKQYWQNFGQLNNSDQFKKATLEKEFNDDVIAEERSKIKKEDLVGGPSRRDFLKYLGFATATAAIASSCKTAINKSIPFLNKPENIVPGEATYYATTFSLDGEVIPVVAKVRDGRPIKIDGNTSSTVFNGATSSQVQASVLSLYDTARLRGALKKNQLGKFEPVPSLSNLDTTIIAKLEVAKGRIAIVTSTLSSPSSLKLVDAFVKMYNANHIVYDAISYSGMLEANQKSYGIKAMPSYRFDNADVIVSVNADFLGTWLSPTEFAKPWSTKRKVKDLKLNKHYQIESLLTITGANADERLIIKPSEEDQVISYLYQQITGNEIKINLNNELKNKLNIIATELTNNSTKALLICGSNDVNVQILVNAINEKLLARGNTIKWANPSKTLQAIDKDVINFASELKNKSYDVVIFAEGVNPAYSFYEAKDFIKSLAYVPLKISLNTQLDETTQLCDYIIPDNHFLESWDDYQIKLGYYSFAQPTINKLFQTRDWQESILVWIKTLITYETYVRNTWNEKIGAVSFDQCLKDGIYNTDEHFNASYSSIAIAEALDVVGNKKVVKNIEIALYQKTSIGSGAMANNPWLQELPDPITKATWDNYAIISMAMAKKLNIAVDDEYEVEVAKPVIKIQTKQGAVELPILVIPGVHSEVIGIAVGYGRTEMIGRTVLGVGKNVYAFTSNNGNNFIYSLEATAVTKTEEVYPIAYTQSHNSYEGRNEVMKEFTLEEFAANKNVIIDERTAEFKKFQNNVTDFNSYSKDATLYQNHEKIGLKWGMSIDLNSCTGCGACVVACNAENNISVVGKKQVLKSHEMHWLRIDRYFSGNPENPDVVFQPMMCQHCDNAPCENVCPVSATNHSSEGLNQMTYNRCIGTRYCANNCPFKVRRFNWLDFNGADSFKNNQIPLVEEGTLDSVVLDMNEDLTRLVLNPDVSVRSRGVIEKCSFCVQRLQAGKINAKKQNRTLQDSDVVTACMQACATDAIVFGNVNDKKSAISKIRDEEQKERVFYVLEQIHVLPNVNYLAKIRNKKSEHKTEIVHH